MNKLTNRQFIDRYFEIVDSKNVERFAEIDSPDLLMKVPMGTVRGIEGHQGLTRGFAAAFPNFKHTVTSFLESDDRIACEGTFVGDHTGSMMLPNGQSIPASNKRVEFEWSGHMRVQNGKVAELHVYFDSASLMAQIGAIK